MGSQGKGCDDVLRAPDIVWHFGRLAPTHVRPTLIPQELAKVSSRLTQPCGPLAVRFFEPIAVNVAQKKNLHLSLHLDFFLTLVVGAKNSKPNCVAMPIKFSDHCASE